MKGGKRPGRRLTTAFYKVKAPIPSPVRFSFVSDLHCFPNGPVIEAIKKGAPDAVLVCGDFVHSEKTKKVGLCFLGEAAEIFPTFVSLGNHENKANVARSDVENTGAVLLDDAFVPFGGVLIGGLTPRGDDPDIAFLDRFAREEGYRILLSHYPQYYDKYVKTAPIDLTLSGHAHGGQWRFFGRGVLAPGQGLFPKYTSGFYDGGRFFVGRGIGNRSPAPRINNPPEVVFFDLTSE
ncbi:MAG: metallophosphoesterase family protein [Clostridia bacterium]|nr:metallophosphoesterase family protein [Clostridia bacterium]